MTTHAVGHGLAEPEEIDPSPSPVRPAAASTGRLTRTQWALLAWVLFVAVLTWQWGLPTSRNNLFLVLTAGLFATTAGNPRAWARVARDWAPLFAILTIYDLLRAHADEWANVHWLPQIHFDRWLFGGTVPTVRLQHLLYTPGSPHWWDYGVFVVYLSHFFVSLVVAALLWKHAHARFKRFAFLFVSLTIITFITYALFPAAPPWLASQSGHGLRPTAKIIDEMWVHIGLRSGATVLSGASHLANPVAAVPSLHAAYPVLLMLFFWKGAGRWRWLLALYSLAMAFTLVYSAEHYAFDILLGWLYAGAVFVAGNRVYDRWVVRRGARALERTALARAMS